MDMREARPAIRFSRISRLLVVLALLAASGALLRVPVAHAAACPGGSSISGTVTWSVSCELNSNVTVNAGATLNVSPGVTVRADNSTYRLIVNGTLNARGTSAQRISFTTTDEGDPGRLPGEWGGIRLGSGSSGHLLEYVDISYAGGYTGLGGAPSLEILTSGATLNNVTVSNGAGDGIQLTDASPSISNTTLTSNGVGNYDRAIDLDGASFPTLSGLSASGNGFDGVAVNGTTLTANYTWGNGGLSSYLVTAQIQVLAGTTLTFAPGTTVYVEDPNTDFTISGTLSAVGTAEAPIRFRSGDSFTSGSASPGNDIGDWGQMNFLAGSGGTLEYVVLEHAGGYGVAAVAIASSNVMIRNSTISNNERHGIQITDASPTISNTTLTNNGVANYGRAIDLNGASFPSLSGLSASGNVFNGVAVNGPTTVTTNYSWGNGGLSSYLVTSEDVGVASGTTLTIVPGTTVYMDGAITDLNVSGTLSAIGTAAAPIHFRSGDSFTNGGTPDSEIGDWGQIEFMAGSSGTLEHVTLEHAGGYLFPALAIASSNVLVRNSTIARNHDDGILVTAGAPRITLSNIEDNGDAGLRNTGSSTVLATCNWWGAASGPTVSSNPGGSGQRIVGAAAFVPWLNDRAPAATCRTVFVPLLRR